MYIVGHFVTSKLAGLFENGIGRNLTFLMIPDYIASHDWGYHHYSMLDTKSEIMKYFKSHMLGDWFVHFGDQKEPRKSGWAYKNMKLFAKKYNLFFLEAEERGLLRKDLTRRDTIRGFSHTMMEYLIDYYMSRSLMCNDLLYYSKRYLGEELLQQPLFWLNDFVNKEEIACAISLEEGARCFGNRVLLSTRLEEFVLRAGIKKFGLTPSVESMSFIASHLEAALLEFPLSKIDQVVEDTALFIKKYL